MTALERIEEIEKRGPCQGHIDAILSMAKQDVVLLLKAFRVMREIAIKAKEGIDHIDSKTLVASKDIDAEFEERMKDGK